MSTSGFSQIRKRSHAQNAISALVREFQKFQASQLTIENTDFRTINKTVTSRLKYSDWFVFHKLSNVLNTYYLPFEPDFNKVVLMAKMDHNGRWSNDGSGFGHHAIIRGSQTLKKGIDLGYGDTLYQYFDGYDSFNEIKDRNNLLNSSTYTIGMSLWCRIYPQDLSDTELGKYRTIISKHDDEIGNNGYALAVLPDGSITFTFVRNGLRRSVNTGPNAIHEIADWIEPVESFDISASVRLLYDGATPQGFTEPDPTYTVHMEEKQNRPTALTTNQVLDLDGIPSMATPKQNGRNWYLRPANLGSLGTRDSDYCFNPSGDILLRIECGSASVVNYASTQKKILHMTGRPDNGRCSIHMASHQRGDEDEAGILYEWDTGAATHHYMKYPDDIVNAEYTLVFKLQGILDMNNEVSWILGGGGHHQPGPYNNQASCYNSHFKYSGANPQNSFNGFSVEFNHGEYERYSVTPLTSYASLENRYFGVKVCGFSDPANWQSRKVITYVCDDPIDLTTGLANPNATWRKHTEWTQTQYKNAFHPHCWGGVNDKMRNDSITSMDLLYASRVEISSLVTPTQTTPTYPTITAVNPSNNATGIAITVSPTITFSSAMDQSTINATNIKLSDHLGNPISGVVSLSSDGKTATFDPNTNLTNGEKYTLQVLTGVKNIGGNALQTQFVSYFTTITSTPVDNGVDVFGVMKLYPSDPAKSSEDWYMSGNINNDPRLDISGSVRDLGSGTWEGNVTSSMTPASFRLNCYTTNPNAPDVNLQMEHYRWVDRLARGFLVDSKDWLNCEMTIYWYVVRWDSPDEMSLYFRGGHHSDGWKVACLATDYKGQIQTAGNSRFAKEYHHESGSNGYKFQAGNPKFQLSNRTNVWTGQKFICYNYFNSTLNKICVHMEVWADESGSEDPTKQNWRLMNVIEDTGSFGEPPNTDYPQECDGHNQEIFTFAGPNAVFRIDNVLVRFKKASVRNIIGAGGGTNPPPTPPPTGYYVNSFGMRKFYTDATPARYYTAYTNSGSQGASEGYRYNWVMPLSVVNTEVGALIKITSASADDFISFKLGGGAHNDTNPQDACCYDIGIPFRGQNPGSSLMRKECPHPDYTSCGGVAPLFTLPSLIQREVGIICQKINQTDGSVKIQAYVNLTPTNNDGTVNNTTWQKYMEYIDHGSCLGGAYLTPKGGTRQDTIRIDYANYQLRYGSAREVTNVLLPTDGQQPPPTTPVCPIDWTLNPTNQHCEPPPQPPSGTQKDSLGINKIYADKVTTGNRFLTNFTLNKMVRNYASGAPSEPSVEYTCNAGSTLRDHEFTYYVHINGFKPDDPDTVSTKLRGGSHSSSNPTAGTCYALDIPTDGADTPNLQVERPHPTMHDNDQPVINHIGTTIVKKWIGIKAITFNVPGQTAVHIATYIDFPVNDINNPPNNWKKFIEVIDSGQLDSGLITTPYGNLFTSRIDGVWVNDTVKSTVSLSDVSAPDFRYASVREISSTLAPVGEPGEPPVPVCPSTYHWDAVVFQCISDSAQQPVTKLPIANITASDYAIGLPPTNAIDGLVTTFWKSNKVGSYIQLDLGETTKRMIVSNIDINWLNGNVSRYTFKIDVSTDGVLFVNKINATSEAQAERYTILPANTVAARFIRITITNIINGLDALGINEIAVNGFQSTLDPFPDPTCPEGYHWDVVQQKCLLDVVGPPATDAEMQITVNGMHYATPSTNHIPLYVGDKDKLLRIGTLYDLPVTNPAFWKFKGGIQDMRIYRNYIFTAEDIANLNDNKMTIRRYPKGQIALAGLATILSTQVGMSGLSAIGFSEIGFSVS